MKAFEMIGALGTITAFIFSFISLIQSMISRKESKEADKKADRALLDSQKKYMPVVRFAGNIRVCEKSIYDLQNQITFDFDKVLMKEKESEGQLLVIEAGIENVGMGIIKGLEINKFFIQSGNKVTNEEDYDDYPETLSSMDKFSCSEYFILTPGEKVNINFIITENVEKQIENYVLDGERYDYDPQQCMSGFFEDYDNFIVVMSMNIMSTNETNYTQQYLMGTYIDGKVIHNSFYEITDKKTAEEKKEEADNKKEDKKKKGNEKKDKR